MANEHRARIDHHAGIGLPEQDRVAGGTRGAGDGAGVDHGTGGGRVIEFDANAAADDAEIGNRRGRRGNLHPGAAANTVAANTAGHHARGNDNAATAAAGARVGRAAGNAGGGTVDKHRGVGAAGTDGGHRIGLAAVDNRAAVVQCNAAAAHATRDRAEIGDRPGCADDRHPGVGAVAGDRSRLAVGDAAAQLQIDRGGNRVTGGGDGAEIGYRKAARQRAVNIAVCPR